MSIFLKTKVASNPSPLILANKQKLHFSLVCTSLALLLAFFACLTVTVRAQENDAEAVRATQLFQSGKYAEAIPLLENLIKRNPQNPTFYVQAGLATYIASNSITDEQELKRQRLRARAFLLQAKKLGVEYEWADAVLDSIPADGSGGNAGFSANKEADKLMREGEAVFSRGEFIKAAKLYEQALAIDPKLYSAALYAGDMYFKQGHEEKDAAQQKQMFEKSTVWFAKAVAIDPETETAHRYWGSALMDQGKMDEARTKVVEAYITQPYARLSSQGLLRWAEMMKINPAHPKIEIPANLIATDNAVRGEWQAKKFKQMFPNEKAYRHTLNEEAEVLRALMIDKNKLNATTLANLTKLEKDGLLEAYILLVRPDDGIAQDYAAYKAKNADKLRRYVSEYILSTAN